MKTSKLLITSLLAAATMGTSAYAGFVWNGGEISQELWQTESSWTLTDGTTWPTGGNGPLTAGSNAWSGVTVANASGTVGTFEGWALGLTLQNANLTVTTLNKLQGGCTLNLDAGSVLTISQYSSAGNDGGLTTLNIEGVFNLTYNKNQGGEGFVANLGNGGVLNFSAYDATARTAKVSTLNATLNTADFDSYTIDANGNTVYTRKLITLGDNVSFDSTNTTVTMTAGAGVGTLTRVENISGADAGSYKLTKDSSGYSVSYVVAGRTYAWNATAADSVWDTSAENWTTNGGSTSIAFEDNGNVFFGAGDTLAKTVAINSAVTAGTISVADNYTFNVGASGSLSATAVAVAGTKTATLNLASNMALSANLVGSGTLKKTGTGLLTYTGTISSGATLEIASAGTASAPNLFSGTLSQGATLNISGGVTKIPGGDNNGNGPIRGDLTIGVGAVAIGTGTDAIPWGNNLAQIIRVLGTLQLDARWSMNSEKKIVLSGGRITGAGGLNNNQTVSLDYFNSGTIATEVGAARSQISANIRIKDTLTFDAAADLAVSGDIVKTNDTNAAKIVKQGAGTLTLSGTNTYRSLEISAGKLVAASAGALGTGAVTVNGDGSILDINLSSGTLTQGENQTLTTTNGGKITVSAGTLALTGAVNLSNAIEVANGANLTTTGDVLFSLANLTGTTNGNVTTYSLFTLAEGSSLTWAEGLGASNVNLAGTSVIGRGAAATFNADGTVTVSDGTAGNLVWNGTSGNSTWNYTATNWTLDANSAAFQNKDNVTFGAGDAGKTVTLVNGTTYRVGNVTVEGSSAYTFSLASGTATISGETLSVERGSTLSVGASDRITIALDFDDISLSGKLVYNNGATTWKKLTFAAADAELKLEDLANGTNVTGLTVTELKMSANGKITSNYGGKVAIGSITGAGDLSIAGPTSNEAITFTLGALSGSGKISTVAGTGTGTLNVEISGDNLSFTGTLEINAGTVKLTSSQNTLGATDREATGTRYAAVVKSGGTLDINGKTQGGNNCYQIELAGGSLVNNGSNVGTEQCQITGLKLSADSTVGGTGNFGLISSYYVKNKLELGGFTLTKTGSNNFWLASTTVNNGVVDVQGGFLYLRNGDSSGEEFKMTSSAMLKANGGEIKAGSAGVALGNVAIVFNDANKNTARITKDTNCSFSVQEGAKLYLDIGALTEATLTPGENVSLTIAAASAIANDSFFSAVEVGTYNEAGSWVKDLQWAYVEGSWNVGAGTLSIAIPEPSVFGLLAGLGALALAGTRRRRRKA
ncbi:MAG: beta strand repeat-containing protein [Candidatus Spyradosoma sp.]